MKLRDFENQKWLKKDQELAFRHKASLKLINKGPVLDLGCGDGFFLKELEQRGILGQGLDISDEAVRKAREKGLKVEQFDFSSQKLPFPNDSFETVVMLDVLEHLYNPLFLLKEARRVTKNYIVLSVPNFNSLPERLAMLLGKIPPSSKPKRGHVYWMNWSVLKNLLKEAELKIEKIEVNSFFCRWPILKNIMQFLAEKIPSIFALNFVIKAKKL